MNKFLKCTLLILLFLGLSSMAVHKFYVAIYQINYVSQKKRIEITARIFIDDLNEALEFKFKKKTFIGTEKESPEDVVLLKKYLADKFTLKVDGQLKPMNFLSKELENNVLICYLNIKDISKVKNIEVQNSIITEIYPKQQNIIQSKLNGEKDSLLLTSEKTNGMLK
jgi:hypothetical protein